MNNCTNGVRDFGIRDKMGYFLGDFGCNMSFSFMNNYMLLFFVTCLGIKPGHFAVIIMVGKIWDAINDPIIGGLCDRTTPGKNGKFKPWIKWGSIPLLISTIAMFSYVPNASYTAKLLLCLISYSVWSVAFTSVNVPYGSLQSVITVEPLQRAELSTFRSMGAMVAQAPIMVVVPLIIFDSSHDPRGGLFIYLVAGMGVIGLIALQMLCVMVTERVESVKPIKKSFNYIKTMKEFITNIPMLGVTISSMAFIAFIGTAMSSMQYLFMCYFKNTSLISIGTVVGGFPVLFAVLFSKKLVKKYGKKKTCTYPLILGIAASGMMTFMEIKNPYIWLSLLGVVMLATGLHMILTWALVADCIDYQQKRTGRREEGSIYATYSLFRKLAQGIGGATVALSLKWTGYIAENGADQLAGVPEKIRFICGFIVFLGTIICFVSMYLLYNIKEPWLTEDKEIA